MATEKVPNLNLIKVREDREIVRLSECKDGVFNVLSDSTWK